MNPKSAKSPTKSPAILTAKMGSFNLKRTSKQKFGALLLATVAVSMTACAANPLQPANEVARHALAQPASSSLTATPGAFRSQRIVVFQPTAMPGPRLVKVRTAPVRTDRNFSGNPYNPAKVAVGSRIPLNAPDQLSRWVLVSGNYTPKGVYLRPDSSSRILTRIAPGARLRLEKTVDGWFKVETEQGVGYLRGHDAKVLATATPGAKARIIRPTS